MVDDKETVDLGENVAEKRSVTVMIRIRPHIGAEVAEPSCISTVEVRAFRPDRNLRKDQALGKLLCIVDYLLINAESDDLALVMQNKVVLTGSERSFHSAYHTVFPATADQQDVYKALTHVVDDSLRGLNSTIIAYGQTGTGKTYTIMGPQSLLHECGAEVK
jgi:hypothetical protein